MALRLAISLVVSGVSSVITLPAGAARAHSDLRAQHVGLQLNMTGRLERLPLKSESFIDFHSHRVERNLVLFQPQVLGIEPELPATRDRLAAPAMQFAAPPHQNELEVIRTRERLKLFREPGERGGAWVGGLAAFAVTTVLAAHLPAPARLIFDGRAHLAPAVFSDGGLGAAVAGRF